MRYIPTFLRPMRLFVMTTGKVTKGPASPGQQWRMGSFRTSASLPFRITSWQGGDAPIPVFGRNLAHPAASLTRRTLSRNVRGGAMSMISFRRRPRSSRSSTPRARRIRAGLPKALVRTGNSEPSTSSNKSACPPCAPFETLSVISAISKKGETLSRMRISSPAASRAAINSRMLRYACVTVFDFFMPATARSRRS